MTFVKLSPFISISALQDRINEAFAEEFSIARKDDGDVKLCNWNPVVDIFETSGTTVLRVELPGVEKKDIIIDVKNNSLTIKGEKFADANIREEDYYCKERCYGIFYRSFTLPDIIDPNAIKASFKNGVLEIQLPQPVEDKPKIIKVDID